MQLNPYKTPARADENGNIIPERVGVSGSPQYQDLLDANPYRNRTYNESPWQKFLSAVGFRTEADAWRENMAVQAAEYDAGIAQQAYAEQYNNPVEQVARMRAAGLNPDIDGGQSISAGEAATPNEDPSTPMQSTGSTGRLGEVVNSVMQAFSTAIGLVQGVQGVRASHLSNTLASIGNSDAMQDFARKMFPNFLPDTPDADYMVNPTDWRSATLAHAEKFAGHLPRKMRSSFLGAIESFWESAPADAEAFKQFTSRVQSRKAFYKEKNENYSDLDDVLDEIWRPLGEVTEKWMSKSLDANLKQVEATEARASNDETYYQTLDSKAQAETENEVNRVSKTNAEMEGDLRDALKKVVEALDKKSKGEGFPATVAQIAKTFIAFGQLWISSQGAPSISRSSSTGGSYYNPITGTKDSHSESGSFSIGW